MQHRPQQLLLYGAVALYGLIGLALAIPGPGLQYDEAMLVQGGVHLLNARTELPLPHDPDTFLCRRERCLPLMTVRYVGAVKEYAGLPLFALAGTSALTVRLLSMLLAAVAVYGLGRLVGRLRSEWAGALAAVALAVHPAFVDQSVFDNGTVAAPFCALGLLLLALARYDEAPSWPRALAIGLAAGFGVWARANFTWVLFALVCAGNWALWRWMRSQPRHAAALAAGCVGGSLPFWLYQWISRGGTFAVFGLFPASESWPQRLASRAVMWSESLVSDREHRAIWNGGVVPAWQAWLFAAVLLAALVVCARKQPRLALATAVLYALHFVSTVQVAEHHFVTVIPFAVAAVAVSGWGRWFLPLYLAIALYWNAAAMRGIRATGGVGQWSDAVNAVRQTIADQQQGRVVQIVDWGLQNNLFVLSRGRLTSREWVGGAAEAPALTAGGLFLAGGRHNTFFPSAAEFHRRLAGTRHLCQEFRERSGDLYARLCDVEPAVPGTVLTASSGLHAAEKEGWRWSKQEFAYSLPVPAAGFALDLFVPEALLAKLGPITLAADGCPPATYRLPGAYRYARDLAAGAAEVRFRLDKALPPQQGDGRELGVIVKQMTVASAR